MIVYFVRDIVSQCLKLKKQLNAVLRSNTTETVYRVVELKKNNDEYFAIVCVVGKSSVFKMRPEEILADDQMTKGFSPTDIRALTYLGYLGINRPKYKILAKRFSNGGQTILFELRKDGVKLPIIKTSSEIAEDEEILRNFDQIDSYEVGYQLGAESVYGEREAMKNLIKAKRREH